MRKMNWLLVMVFVLCGTIMIGATGCDLEDLEEVNIVSGGYGGWNDCSYMVCGEPGPYVVVHDDYDYWW